MRAIALIGWVLSLSSSQVALAQHSIDVQRKAADGDYMAALVTYEKMPKRIVTSAAQLAAARSAWALGLSTRALDEYDKALKQGGLEPREIARIYLSKGIIEYQENRPQIAVLDAEKALTLLPDASPVRGQVFALWGQSLADMKQYAQAEDKFKLALEECESDQKVDIYYHLGNSQLQLGKFEEAKENLEKIPLKQERASSAMRLLAQIALETKNLSSAAFWVEKGREEFPDSFLDSWSDYVMLRAATEKKDPVKVRAIRESANKRYPPSDPWVSLLNALAEEFEWQGGAN